MLAAQEDIANRIVKLAQRKDMTVYQTVNDILEQALRVEEVGINLKQVVDERWMLERAQETGFTFTIEQLLYRIVDVAYESDKEKFTFSFIGEKLTPGYIELYCIFIEELLTVLGYKLLEKEINRGIIKLEMRR
jgi:hypothetical protein